MQWTVKDMEVWLVSFLQLILDLLGVFQDGDYEVRFPFLPGPSHSSLTTSPAHSSGPALHFFLPFLGLFLPTCPRAQQPAADK